MYLGDKYLFDSNHLKAAIIHKGNLCIAQEHFVFQ